MEGGLISVRNPDIVYKDKDEHRDRGVTKLRSLPNDEMSVSALIAAHVKCFEELVFSGRLTTVRSQA